MEGEEAAVAAAEERVGVGAVAVGRAIGEVGLLPLVFYHRQCLWWRKVQQCWKIKKDSRSVPFDLSFFSIYTSTCTCSVIFFVRAQPLAVCTECCPASFQHYMFVEIEMESFQRSREANWCIA